MHNHDIIMWRTSNGEDGLPYDVIIDVNHEQEREVNLINMEGLYVICQTNLYVCNK